MGDWAGKLVGAVCRIAGIFHGLIIPFVRQYQMLGIIAGHGDPLGELAAEPLAVDY